MPVLAGSDIVEVKSEKAKAVVIELDKSIKRVSEKVLACMKQPDGTREKCACKDLENCEFQSEYQSLITTFCKAKKDHPEWADKTVNVRQDSVTIALGMAGLDRQLGSNCN
jgi:uncharacterized metal-binding protein